MVLVLATMCQPTGLFLRDDVEMILYHKLIGQLRIYLTITDNFKLLQNSLFAFCMVNIADRVFQSLGRSKDCKILCKLHLKHFSMRTKKGPLASFKN